MTNQANFAFFLDQLYENAVLSFRETEEGRLWQEKRKQMELACDCMLTEEQMDFVTDCFDLLLQADAQEACYIYRKGICDSVAILKWLGVLARTQLNQYIQM